jgi:quinol monooxygenase YgiN
MLLITGTFRMTSAQLAPALPAMAAMIDASRAETGCLHYSYAQDVRDPHLIHVSELWADQAALDAHMASSHIMAWRAQWPTLGLHDRNLTLYQADHPRPC